MPKQPKSHTELPPLVGRALTKLGEDLAIARVRRRESQRVWAKRLGVSVPTLVRMERGDPGVGMGIYATALWLIGRTKALADLAEPAMDSGAIELDVRAAKQRRAVRSKASLRARLAQRENRRG